MELAYQSTGILSTRAAFNVPATKNKPVIALAGNPNTGKSTLFNALTGLKQHTGNWPGKTVLQTKGNFAYKGRKYTIVDLPGTYSLLANSADEQVARDFICFAKPDATIIVVDATCLERNLNLALQIMEITDRVILCVNLIDEARRKKIIIDFAKLSKTLGIPVVATAARTGEGLPRLLEVIDKVVSREIKPQPKTIYYEPEVEDAIARLEPKIKALVGSIINPRWVALRLLDGDTTIIQALENFYHPGKIDLAGEEYA